MENTLSMDTTIWNYAWGQVPFMPAQLAACFAVMHNLVGLYCTGD